MQVSSCNLRVDIDLPEEKRKAEKKIKIYY